MDIKQIKIHNSITKWILCIGTEANTFFICFALDISYQKLSAVARKHNGRFLKRKINCSNYVAFSKEEDARSAADELDALILAKKLGSVNNV